MAPHRHARNQPLIPSSSDSSPFTRVTSSQRGQRYEAELSDFEVLEDGTSAEYPSDGLLQEISGLQTVHDNVTVSLNRNEALDRLRQASDQILQAIEDEQPVLTRRQYPGRLRSQDDEEDPYLRIAADGSRSTADRGTALHRAAEIHRNRVNPPDPHETRTVEVAFDESSSSVRSRSTARPPGYWKMRNGMFIRIMDMEDTHLNNTISLCERNSLTRGRRLTASSPGIYSELVAERTRRQQISARNERHDRETRAVQQRNFNESFVTGLWARPLRRVPIRNTEIIPMLSETAIDSSWSPSSDPNIRQEPINHTVQGNVAGSPMDDFIRAQQARVRGVINLSPSVWAGASLEVPSGQDLESTPVVQEPQLAPTAIPEGQPKRRIKS